MAFGIGIPGQQQGQQDEEPNQYQQAMAAVGGPLTMAASYFGQEARRNRAYHQSMEMAQNQYNWQRALNQQGADLQYDLWNKTNFAAQVKHMKAAGLSPGLMYKQGGPGGTTGSQTGGSAKGGNVPAIQPMDMQNILMGAQARKLEEESKNLAEDRRLKLVRQITEKGQLDLDTRKLEELSIPELEARLKNIDSEIERRGTQNEVDRQRVKQEGDKIEAEIGRMDFQNKLDKAREELSYEQLNFLGLQKEEIGWKMEKLVAEIDLIVGQDKLNWEVLNEYDRGISKNPLSSAANFLGIDIGDPDKISEKEGSDIFEKIMVLSLLLPGGVGVQGIKAGAKALPWVGRNAVSLGNKAYKLSKDLFYYLRNKF